MSRLVEKKNVAPYVLITSLFFLWGFARSILDVLNKHFQETLSISITRSALIQAITYLGYFLMAIPAGILITRYGYRRGVTIGLLLFSAGCLLFIPGERLMSFNLFLCALFVIGCGLVMLETAANPYASELGDRATAASRLNLSQSFNGLGCILGPVTVGELLSGGNGVAFPYAVMGIFVGILALIFSKISLPEISISDDNNRVSRRGIRTEIGRLLAIKEFRFGLMALFCYEVAEIAINSLFINYATENAGIAKESATYLLSFGALGCFMLARITGSWVMSKIPALKVLLSCAIGALLCAATVAVSGGSTAITALMGCYIFEAIMFPTIFALTITHAGQNVKTASSLLMMTPLGGAIGTLLMGIMADETGLAVSFAVPAAGYLAVGLYAIYALARKKG